MAAWCGFFRTFIRTHPCEEKYKKLNGQEENNFSVENKPSWSQFHKWKDGYINDIDRKHIADCTARSWKSILMNDCVLRGDMNSIRAGKYCVVGERTVIRPSYKRFSKGLTFFPVHIGDHVFIESDCVIMAAQIGAYVHIGHDAVVGRSVILRDCVQVLPNTVVPPDAVIPPFSIVGGNPGVIVGELPESTQELMTQATKSFYDGFTPGIKDTTIVA